MRHARSDDHLRLVAAGHRVLEGVADCGQAVDLFVGQAVPPPADRFSGCLRTLTGVACRISELVIDAADPERLAAFWSKVLGYVELGREDDGSIEIGPPDAGFGGPQPTLVLSPSSDPRTGKLRLHIDVNATDRDQDAELERLLALGARPADVGQTGTESWHVLADPEGNEFCLLHTRLQPL
jgi:catechol 2,3-dioxygenase-like lactoylglutathione lyase family enzyme